MIRFRLKDGQDIGMAELTIAQAMAESMPRWLTGLEPCTRTDQQLVRTGVKNLMPLLLGMAHRAMLMSGSTMVPPNLKSAAAKQNIIFYAINYLIGNVGLLLAEQVYATEGHMQDGTYVITGLSPITSMARGAAEATEPAAGTTEGVTGSTEPAAAAAH